MNIYKESVTWRLVKEGGGVSSGSFSFKGEGLFRQKGKGDAGLYLCGSRIRDVTFGLGHLDTI